MYLDQALSTDPFEEACVFQLLHEQKVLPGPTGDRRHRRGTARLFCGSEPGNGRSWKPDPGTWMRRLSASRANCGNPHFHKFKRASSPAKPCSSPQRLFPVSTNLTSALIPTSFFLKPEENACSLHQPCLGSRTASRQPPWSSPAAVPTGCLQGHSQLVLRCWRQGARARSPSSCPLTSPGRKAYISFWRNKNCQHRQASVVSVSESGKELELCR